MRHTLRQPFPSVRDVALWLGRSNKSASCSFLTESRTTPTRITGFKTPLRCTTLRPSVLWGASKPTGKFCFAKLLLKPMLYSIFSLRWSQFLIKKTKKWLELCSVFLLLRVKILCGRSAPLPSPLHFVRRSGSITWFITSVVALPPPSAFCGLPQNATGE